MTWRSRGLGCGPQKNICPWEIGYLLLVPAKNSQLYVLSAAFRKNNTYWPHEECSTWHISLKTRLLNNWSQLWLTDLLWYILTTLKLVHEGFTYTHSEKDYIGNSKQLSLKWFYCVCPHLPVGVKDTFHNFFTIHIFTLSPKPPEKTLDVVSAVTVQV